MTRRERGALAGAIVGDPHRGRAASYSPSTCSGRPAGSARTTPASRARPCVAQGCGTSPGCWQHAPAFARSDRRRPRISTHARVLQAAPTGRGGSARRSREGGPLGEASVRSHDPEPREPGRRAALRASEPHGCRAPRPLPLRLAGSAQRAPDELDRRVPDGGRARPRNDDAKVNLELAMRAYGPILFPSDAPDTGGAHGQQSGQGRAGSGY